MGIDKHWQVVQAGLVAYSNTAEDIFKQACKYFEWCDNHPLKKSEIMRSAEMNGKVVEKDVIRPYTLSGLCLHTGITSAYLYSMLQSKSENDKICAERIIEIIKTQHIEMSLIGNFNPIMVSKMQGLSNTKEVEKGAPIINVTTILVEGTPKLLEDENENTEK